MHTLLTRASRHLADTLSAMNAFFGVISCVCAAQGRPDLSLLLLIAGAVCDGLDGAAARRFGGTRFGVLADDIADGISYAIAPAIAVAVVTTGTAGTIVGVAFGALTIARLVYFTLKKGASDTDPGTFRGLPSTVGGVVVLAAAILAPDAPALVAFCAGMAVVLMISFDAGFVHLGRAVATLEPGQRARVAVAVVVTAALAIALGPKVLATCALWVSLTYAFAPHLERFTSALRDHGARARDARRRGTSEAMETATTA